MTLKTQIGSGLFCSAALLLSAATAAAEPLTLQCPAHYPDLIEMQSLQSTGWRAPFPGAPNAPLEEVGVSLGPADENGELQGEGLPGGGRAFRFPGRASELEKWIFCGYSASKGYVRVMYQIPPDEQRCETHIKRARGRLVAASIRCE